MSMEIDKMVALREKAVGEEKNEIAMCMNMITSKFKEMVFATGNRVSGNLEENVKFEEVKSAIATLRSLGEKYGVEFPKIETDKQAAAYILKIGMDVLKN